MEQNTIVLAEDDDAVRRMMRVLLNHYGYRVLEAANGEEASMLCGADLRVDLVITDLSMPLLDGRGLLRRLAYKEQPPRVLVCTGGIAVEGVPLLRKPFTPQQLEAAVAAALLGPPLSLAMLDE